jgi:hypothetical protein
MKPGVLVLVFLLLASFASAHEHQIFRIGDSTYDITMGSLNEPVFVDDKSGVDMRIVKVTGPNTTEPVSGLGETLKVEVIAGDKKQTFALAPAFGAPGTYTAPFYPTVATTYTYRVFGTINNVAVDLSFVCNPAGHPPSETDKTELVLADGVTRIEKRGAFGCPRARDTLSFPEPVSSMATMNAQLAAPVKEQGTPAMVWAALGIAAVSLIVSFVALRR